MKSKKYGKTLWRGTVEVEKTLNRGWFMWTLEYLFTLVESQSCKWCNYDPLNVQFSPNIGISFQIILGIQMVLIIEYDR